MLNKPMYLVSSCNLKINYVIEMQLDLIFYWLSLCNDFTPYVGLSYRLMVSLIISSLLLIEIDCC